MHNAKKNTIILNHNLNTYDYKLYSDYELKNGAVWIPASDDHSIDRDNLHSVNDVIRNYGITKSYGGANLYVSGVLDLSNFHNIYISSPNLGSFSTMGARGEAGIIRKIPVTSDYGYVIQEKSYMEYDLIECSKQTLSVLEFQLRDARGN